MCYHVCRNLTRPLLVKNLTKGIVNLCISQESGSESLELRKQIIGRLVTRLLSIESSFADADSDADNKSKGLKKASSFRLFCHGRDVSESTDYLHYCLHDISVFLCKIIVGI